jgi:SH3-like domain-containing protein
MRFAHVALAVLLVTSPFAVTAQASQRSATVIVDRTNLRAEPSVDASILAALNNGTVVDVFETIDAWTKVSAGGKTGWVRASTLNVRASVSTMPAPRPQVTATTSRVSADQPAAVPGRSRGSSPGIVSPSLFEPGTLLGGPSVLIGNTGGSLALGLEFEYGLTKLPNIGSGTIGLGFRAHTYSITEANSSLLASVRVTPVAIAANYHFVLKDSKVDPYVGLAAGYASASYSDSRGSNFSISSGTYLMLDGGARYYLSPRTAVQAGVSLGSRGDVGLLRLAAMFRF